MRPAVWICALAAALPAQKQRPAPVELNAHVLRVLKRYPTDGTCRYFWPRDDKSTWAGNTRDMRYRGSLFAKGDPRRRSFCCGLTFEVWFFAYREWFAAQGKKADEDGAREFVVPAFETGAKLTALREQWFGSDGDRRCSDHALGDNRLGCRIAERKDARAGDFVQFWRHSGSGHSAVFISWVRDGEKIVGLRYWSTQKATKGIGYREERFGGQRGIDPKQVYITRAVAGRVGGKAGDAR